MPITGFSFLSKLHYPQISGNVIILSSKHFTNLCFLFSNILLIYGFYLCRLFTNPLNQVSVNQGSFHEPENSENDFLKDST